MREMTIPDSGSKRTLLDVAEKLFAERGFQAVSVRDITQEAKMNVAAVNYHFGSRDGLLTLVMLRYLLPVTEERLARLDAIEKKALGKGVAVGEILEAFLRPLVAHAEKSTLADGLFYKLLGRIFAQQGDGLPKPVEDQLKQITVRFGKAFAKALPAVPPGELAWRIHFLVGGMIHLLLHQDCDHSGGGAAETAASLDHFIRYTAAGLTDGIETDAPAKKGPQATFDF